MTDLLNSIQQHLGSKNYFWLASSYKGNVDVVAILQAMFNLMHRIFYKQLFKNCPSIHIVILQCT